MSALPNEISFDITNFLPNDDVTDLMLVSRNFNALVTPRLQKIKEDRATMNQSIKSPVPEISDDKWIAQLNLKGFEPIGSAAKKRMKDIFESIRNGHCHRNESIDRVKERMSLERFDDATFLHILSALLSKPEFRQGYNISEDVARDIYYICKRMVIYRPLSNFTNL